MDFRFAWGCWAPWHVGTSDQSLFIKAQLNGDSVVSCRELMGTLYYFNSRWYSRYIQISLVLFNSHLLLTQWFSFLKSSGLCMDWALFIDTQLNGGSVASCWKLMEKNDPTSNASIKNLLFLFPVGINFFSKNKTTNFCLQGIWQKQKCRGTALSFTSHLLPSRGGPWFRVIGLSIDSLLITEIQPSSGSGGNMQSPYRPLQAEEPQRRNVYFFYSSTRWQI